MKILEQLSMKGKKALITGGAQGLGEIFSYALAEAGADIYIADINEDLAKKTAQEIADSCKVKTMAVKVNVADELSVDNMYDQIISTFGDLDVCVANAGINIPGGVFDISFADWKKVFDVNIHGVFLTCRGAGRIMIKNNKGSIINIASINARTASYATSAAYCSAKGAVLNFTRELAREWGKYGIRVNSISPGNMVTELINEWSVSEYMDMWKNRTAFNRIGRPDELKSTVLYLASDASSYTTGSDVTVDGGHTCI